MDEATRGQSRCCQTLLAIIRKLRERIEQLEASNAELRERVFGE